MYDEIKSQLFTRQQITYHFQIEKNI